MYRQYRLTQPSGVERVCWLESDDRLKVGTRLTIKNDFYGEWTVAWRSYIELSDPPEKRWRVGGLS